jgi:hypothetical protein
MSFEQTWRLTVWIACLLGMPESQASAGLGYHIEKYDESPGLYYEHLGETTLYNTEWKTVVYVSLEQTDSKTNQLGQYIEHVNRLCHATEVQNWTDCSHFYTISRGRFNQIKSSEKLLRELIGIKNPYVNAGEHSISLGKSVRCLVLYIPMMPTIITSRLNILRKTRTI